MNSFSSRVSTSRVSTVSTSNDIRFSDHALLICTVALALFGAVMIGSASTAFAQNTYQAPFYFIIRQLIFLAIGGLAGAFIFFLPLALWEKYGLNFIVVSLIFLALVLVPFIGKEVNGSRRWIDFGLFTVQVSEAVKLFIIVYLAGYLVRRGHLVQTTFGGFLRPLCLISVACFLLLLEPDFGAAVVIASTATLMLFVAGVRFSQFMALTGVLAALASSLIFFSPYRLRRFVGFMHPFDDPFGAGYQLSNSLIAIGGGGITGTGFGNSIQKMDFLPEAHTDFLFAVLSEELGLIGVTVTICLYGFIVWRCFYLSRKAEDQGNRFAGFLALGIGIWIGLQAFINMGVTLGVLPTKGITLPLMSYGGSSAVVFCMAFGLLLRVEWDLLQAERTALRAGDPLTEEAYP